MAISKKRRGTGTPPDPAAFDHLVREGLADAEVVLDAYDHVLSDWLAQGGHAATTSPGDIVQERPVTDPNEPLSVSTLSIVRHRARHFDEDPIQTISTVPQEEA